MRVVTAVSPWLLGEKFHGRWPHPSGAQQANVHRQLRAGSRTGAERRVAGHERPGAILRLVFVTNGVVSARKSLKILSATSLSLLQKRLASTLSVLLQATSIYLRDGGATFAETGVFTSTGPLASENWLFHRRFLPVPVVPPAWLAT